MLHAGAGSWLSLKVRAGDVSWLSLEMWAEDATAMGARDASWRYELKS